MRRVPVLCVLVPLVSIAVSRDARQEHHGQGNMVMGFDPARTIHHFLLFNDGGAIDVGVKESADATNRDAIRSHLPHIAMMFAEGDFEAPMLVHDAKNVPGTKLMAQRKGAIRYQYVETADGGRVNIGTSDPEALAAVHAFLTFQIAEHKTGDPITVRTR